MRNKSSVSMLSVSLLLAVVLIAPSVRAQNTSADHFARGKQLVENNCVDCEGGTQKGEEEGIRELEAALEAHSEKPVDAYKLLAEAYANMSTYVGKDETQARAFRNKEYDIYRKLYALVPEDEEVLMDYSRTLPEGKEQIPIFQKVLSVNPKNTNARFSLGELLFRENKVKEGLEEMKQAVALESDPESVRNDVQRVIEALDQHHCPLQNAAAYNDEVFEAETAATQGAGNPQPMVAFKKKFAAALEQHACVARE
jgi:tetratricopeptide (TPR) repeat protein